LAKWRQVALTAGGLVLADQLTKLAAWHWLAPVERIKLIPGFFDLTFVLNTGVAFGLMSGRPDLVRVLFLAGAAFFALGVITVFIATADPRQRLFLWGLALVAGGAVGNIIDRLRLSAVIDFLDFYLGSYHWPAFNLADAGITVGTGFIIIHLWRTR